MAKNIFEKSIEKAALIFVGEAARKLSKNLVGRAEQEIKKRGDAKKAKRTDQNIEDEDTIE